MKPFNKQFSMPLKKLWDIQYVFGQDYFSVLRPRLDFNAFQSFFFLSLCAVIVDLIQCEQCTPQQLFQHLLINFSATFQSRDLQISLFNNFFIKNGSHGTIHTFKNYFVTMFSVFSFQFSVFSNNKLNPNGPINEITAN